MLWAILLTILAIVMAYPGLSLVFSLTAISAFALGQASRKRGGTGVLWLLVSGLIFAAYLVATGISWAYAVKAWLEIGL